MHAFSSQTPLSMDATTKKDRLIDDTYKRIGLDDMRMDDYASNGAVYILVRISCIQIIYAWI